MKLKDLLIEGGNADAAAAARLPASIKGPMVELSKLYDDYHDKYQFKAEEFPSAEVGKAKKHMKDMFDAYFEEKAYNMIVDGLERKLHTHDDTFHSAMPYGDKDRLAEFINKTFPKAMIKKAWDTEIVNHEISNLPHSLLSYTALRGSAGLLSDTKRFVTSFYKNHAKKPIDDEAKKIMAKYGSRK